MIDYSGKEVFADGCYSCAYARHEFSVHDAPVFENDMLIVSQDWELPIVGFMIVCPKKHAQHITEFSEGELSEIMAVVLRTVRLLKQLRVADEFDIILPERESGHFHIWICPKSDWVKSVTPSPTKNLQTVFDRAKAELRTSENIKQISRVCDELRELFAKAGE